MTELKESISRILKSLEGKPWVKCPLCREEWNRLRPCSYLDGQDYASTNVCVTCAESVQSLEKVMALLKVDLNSLEIVVSKKKPYDELSRSWGNTFDNERAFRATIKNIKPIIEIDVIPEDMRLRVVNLITKTTEYFNNIFQVVSYFKNLIESAKRSETMKPDEGKW